MSYILEALRKAERERRVSRIPTLDAAYGDPDAPRRRPSSWPWAISGAVALCAVVVYLAWMLSRPAPVEQAASGVPKSPAVETRPSPASAPVPSAPSLARAPAPAEPAASLVPPPPVAPPSGAPKLARPREPASRASLAPSAPPAGPTEAEPRLAPAASGTGGSSAGLRPGTAPEVRAAPPTGSSTGSAPSEPRPAAIPPGPAASPEPARPVPSGAPARFTLDVLVYSDAPAERFVFINGRKYVEGQAVDGETVVEQITPDGAVLRNAERRIVLSPKLNPYTRPRSP